jgi:hypothetical protein
MSDPAVAARNFPQGLQSTIARVINLGPLARWGVLSNYLVMSKRALFRDDVSLPLSAIQSWDALGVYLNVTRQDIYDLTLGG